MATEIRGRLVGAEGRSFAVVVARWNGLVTERLLTGTRETLARHGVSDERVTIVYVPGSFEIPLVAERLAASKRYAAVIALGALIRGSTPHFDHIASSCTSGLGQAALRTGVPIAFGVLTCDTIEQAIERAGTKAGNKGEEAALAALEMADVLAQLPAAGA